MRDDVPGLRYHIGEGPAFPDRSERMVNRDVLI